MNSTITGNRVSVMDFRPVSEDDIPFLADCFRAIKSRSNDFSIGGLMMWVDYFDYELALVENSLIIKGRDPETGNLLFYKPCGNLDLARYCEMVKYYCAQTNQKGYIIIPQPRDAAEPASAPNDNYDSLPDWKEYLYDIEKFETFGGRKMEKKRNHLNFFIHNYSPFGIEPICSANIAELITFTLAFSSVHDDSALAQYECSQVVDVLRKFSSYPFEGVAVRKDGNIIGYTFGEVIGDTCFVHAEKGDVAYRGIYQLLASSMAKHIADRYPQVRYLNREEDMGDESLRLNKESYHPALYIDKQKIEV